MSNYKTDMNTSEDRLNYVLSASGFAIVEKFVDEEFLSKVERIAFSYEEELDEFVQRGGKLDSLAGTKIKNSRAIYCIDRYFNR